MLKIVDTQPPQEGVTITIDELARQGAQRTLDAEVAEYIEWHAHERGEDGRRLVVRNGRAKARKRRRAR